MPRRTAALVGLLLCSCSADLLPGSGGPAEKLEPSAVVLTRATFAPTTPRPSWLGGFSTDDLWFAPLAGGAMRAQGKAAPVLVPELGAAVVGGPLSNPAFLPGGDAFFTVLAGTSGGKLVHWFDGQVDDETAALVGGPADFDRVLAAKLTPGGDYVVLVRDASDARRVNFFSWNIDRFDAGPSFELPADWVSTRVVPVSASEAVVVAADKTGLYRIARFDGTTLSPGDLANGQLSSLLPTGLAAGFFIAGGLTFWNGSALEAAPAPPDSPVYLPFAPDGLATIETTGSTNGFANPRIVVQHATSAATRYGIGDAAKAASRHWLAAGIVGTEVVVMVDGTAPGDPSIAAVDLAP